MADAAVPLTPPKRPLWKRLLPLVGLLLLAWILSTLDLTAMGQAFAKVSVQAVLLAATSFSINMLIKGVRWQRLLAAQGLPLPLPVAMAAFTAAQFYGQVTVGRVGEFTRAEALTERGASPARALASCFYDRVLDLALVLSLGALLGAFVVGQTRAALAAAALLLLGACGLLVLVFPALLPVAVRNLVNRLLTLLEGNRVTGRVLGFVRELFSGMRPMMHPVVMGEALAWTALSWLCYFAALWLLADGVGLDVSRTILTAGASLAALSALLPVTFSGLGARELIFKELLALEGAPGEVSVALALMHLAVMSGSAIGIGLLGVWVRQRQHARSA